MKWGMDMETKATVEIARVRSGKEPQLGQKNLSSGNRTSIISKRSLYIANPKNATSEFTVIVSAVVQ